MSSEPAEPVLRVSTTELRIGVGVRAPGGGCEMRRIVVSVYLASPTRPQIRHQIQEAHRSATRPTYKGPSISNIEGLEKLRRQAPCLLCYTPKLVTA